MHRLENQCQGKVKYPTQESAAKHLKHLNKQGGRKVSIYYCELCGNYHIGHNCKGKKLRKVKDTPIVYTYEPGIHIANRRFIK